MRGSSDDVASGAVGSSVDIVKAGASVDARRFQRDQGANK
jgi:hypothetical protein